MKRFNIAVVAIWLTIFFCSLFSTGSMSYADLNEMTGFYGLVARTNNSINEFMWSNIHWSTVPEDPVIVKSGTVDGKPVYDEQDEYNNVVDNRMTQTILRNTFIPLLLLLGVLNIAFYAGNGAIGRRFGDGAYVIHWFREEIWGKQIKSWYLEHRARRRSKKREEADTNKYHERLAEQRGLD